MKKYDTYLGMRPGDLEGKPYAKFWKPLGPMQPHVKEALIKGPQASELGYPIEERDRVLEPGYELMENGYTRLDNGQIFVSHLCKMPGVKPYMFDWWMGWHHVEPQRYKLWSPTAHHINRVDDALGDVTDVPDRKKWAGMTHHVLEYMGNDLTPLVAVFDDQSAFYDVEKFHNLGNSLAVGGTISYDGKGISFGTMIHNFRETEDGCEMRTRTWLGAIEFTGLPKKGLINQLVSSKFVAKHAVPIELGRDCLVHLGQEYNHLSTFLADIYAMYHPEGKFEPNPQVEMA